MILCQESVMKMALRKKTTLDGIASIIDAVHTRQQKITARKIIYSRRSSWEYPGRTFACGQGYCTQQALALKKNLRKAAERCKGLTRKRKFSGIRQNPFQET